MIGFPDFVENSLALKVMSTGIVSLIKIGGVIERYSGANGSNSLIAAVGDLKTLWSPGWHWKAVCQREQKPTC